MSNFRARYDMNNPKFNNSQSTQSYFTISPERNNNIQNGNLPILYMNRSGSIAANQVNALPSVAKELQKMKNEQGMNRTRSVLVDTIDEGNE